MRLICLISACFIIAFSTPVPAKPVPESFADLVETLSPAVVNISTRQKVKAPGFSFKFKGLPPGDEFDPFREFFERFGGGEFNGERQREVTSLGSGFVIDPEGYIVTNNHVVETAEEIVVTFHDEKKYDAEVIGRDPKTDLALLKIETKQKLPHVTFGDSDTLRVGEWVLAIGNPFGLGGSVSAGIVSARSRDINVGPFDDFIQTDAAINRGNSGGPLFNINGEVVGVNSAIFSPSGGNIGIGFSIPSALAEPVLKQLREHGRTHRGWLGVKIQRVSEEIADSLGLSNTEGALVLEVSEDSPAEEGGVEPGDVILEFDGRRVEEMRKLPRIVAETKIGTRVKLVVWRKGREKTLTITLGELEEGEEIEEASSAGPKEKSLRGESFLGMKLSALNRSLRSRYDLDKDLKGVLVIAVETGSKVAEQGIRPNDVIVEINQDKVASVSELKDAIKAVRKKGRDFALARINRGGTMLFVTIPVEE